MANTNGLKKLAFADLPIPTGKQITVSFKHEGDRKGMPIGPVIVVDEVSYERWKVANGIKGHGIPFGSTPDGLHRLGWFTRNNALKIAAHYGVGLKES